MDIRLEWVDWIGDLLVVWARFRAPSFAKSQVSLVVPDWNTLELVGEWPEGNLTEHQCRCHCLEMPPLYLTHRLHLLGHIHLHTCDLHSFCSLRLLRDFVNKQWQKKFVLRTNLPLLCDGVVYQRKPENCNVLTGLHIHAAEINVSLGCYIHLLTALYKLAS